MTVQELIQKARELTTAERQELVQALQSMSDLPKKTYRLSDLRGVGAEIWRDVDVDDYLNQLRNEWG